LKNRIRKIEIKNPCHENWDAMTDASGGKFCMSCQKNVVDFSRFSNQQILEYLGKSGNTCGKFGDFQLDGFNRYLVADKKPSFFKKWSFTALFAGLLPFINITAKAKPLTEHQQKVMVKQDIESADTVKLRIITGRVGYGGGLLAGATVKVINSNLSVLTDEKGHFELAVPVAANTLIISYPGCKKINVPIYKAKKTGYHFVLSLDVNTPAKLTINSTNTLQGTKTMQDIKLPKTSYVARLPAFGEVQIITNPRQNGMIWYNIWTK
jgi:hypothetical protein